MREGCVAVLVLEWWKSLCIFLSMRFEHLMQDANQTQLYALIKIGTASQQYQSNHERLVKRQKAWNARDIRRPCMKQRWSSYKQWKYTCHGAALEMGLCQLWETSSVERFVKQQLHNHHSPRLQIPMLPFSLLSAFFVFISEDQEGKLGKAALCYKFRFGHE